MHVISQNKTFSFGLGTIILALLSVLGFSLTVYRWVVGLGVTTALSDSRGWGLWIPFDVMFGIAIAAGAFTIASVVYIFHMKRFYPILRPTILTGLIGYTLAAIAVVIDLGFPYRFWHMVVYWNIHSPLFEIGWCVMLYSNVLALEFSPALFERLGWKVPLKGIRAITIPLVITGIVLSSMHQSTLGTMFLLMPQRVPPLWFSGILPILFFVSAVCVGLAMIVFESTLSAKVFKRKLESNLLSDLSKAIPYILGLYLALKVGDLIVAGDLGQLFTGGFLTVLFWVEVVVGVVLPLIFFSMESVRKDQYKRFWSAVLIIVGVAINRLSVGLIAFDAGAYAPTWIELFITIGWFSIGIFAFYMIARFLPVFTDDHP